MIHFPVVDIARLRDGSASEQRAEVGQLGRACRETGFFCISGHGISPDRKLALFEASRQFFALPLTQKLAVSITRSPHNRGYVGMESERLNEAARPDRKEAFNIGLEMCADHPEILAGRPLRGVNFWPEIPGWRDTMLDYYDRCLAIGVILHRGISIDLGVDPHYFDAKIAAPAAVLRLLHYPARSGQTGRYSIAFFLDPNPDAMVEPIVASPADEPRYPPVSVRDYLLSRLDATYEHRQPSGSAS
jgi:isopenicillin N synthase-like dioxygenase